MAKRDEEGNPIIEPQRNWSLILHELRSISYDKKGKEIMEAINEENVDAIKELNRFYPGSIDDFVFSYPAVPFRVTTLCVSLG